jgi:hypothetical protein
MNTNVAETVKDKVQEAIAEETALQVVPTVVEASEVVVREEIQASHMKNMGMMAIENELDSDRAEYDSQLDEIRRLVDKTNTSLKKAEEESEREISRFKECLIRTELRKHAAARIKEANRIKDREYDYSLEIENDKSFTVICYEEGSEEAKTAIERVPHVTWRYSLCGKNKSGNTGPSIPICGTRKLSKKCLDALKEVSSLQADLVALGKANQEVRISIQKLEQERRTLQRKLRQNILQNSAVGAEISARLKANRKKVKALPVPAKFRK